MTGHSDHLDYDKQCHHKKTPDPTRRENHRFHGGFKLGRLSAPGLPGP